MNEQEKARVEEAGAKILHEICLCCVHKPLEIHEGLFHDSPKTHTGTNCYKNLDGSNYCDLAEKALSLILNLKDSNGNPLIYIAHPDDNLPTVTGDNLNQAVNVYMKRYPSLDRKMLEGFASLIIQKQILLMLNDNWRKVILQEGS